tara:strand:- start:333 stop:704 length:372 start_codon:yes stop_codon:yes gene_type:complete
MNFPNDIWREIFSFFHSSYKKPYHLDEYNSIVIKDIWNELRESLISIIDNYTLYRFIMETTVWTSDEFNLENWYCWIKFFINDNNYGTYISNLKIKKSRKRVYLDFIKIFNEFDIEYNNQVLD